MNNTEISKTLNMLRNIIDMKIYELGVDDDKIRVRIGREVMAWMNGYNRELIECAAITEYKTIFGYPIEIEYDNPMCLEVHIVEKVPIYNTHGELKEIGKALSKGVQEGIKKRKVN